MIGTAAKAVIQDLKCIWYDWNTLQRTVTIKRRERCSASDPWEEEVQQYRTAYYVVDARTTCSDEDEIEDLFLAGVYGDGDSCIERWTRSEEHTSELQSL